MLGFQYTNCTPLCIDRLQNLCFVALQPILQEFLAHVSVFPGSGAMTDEWYFILDHGVPKNLEYQRVLGEALQRALPIQVYVAHGGFDLGSFTLQDIESVSHIFKTV
jgi:hypothetical protein